jgi:hypothetical protein
MSAKIDTHRAYLQNNSNWLPYLAANSGLPGPRGNLELAQAVVDVAARSQLESLLAVDETHPPENTPETFIVFCGIKGMGKFAEDDPAVRKLFRRYADDPRWRIREAVAQGMQVWGGDHIHSLIDELRGWTKSSALQMRAAAAAISEPALLKAPEIASAALEILDEITASFLDLQPRTAEEVRTLRQGLAYCWSVVVAAHPESGKTLMEKWAGIPDKDIRWMLAENLKKNRLIKMDPTWVARMTEKICV